MVRNYKRQTDGDMIFGFIALVILIIYTTMTLIIQYADNYFIQFR